MQLEELDDIFRAKNPVKASIAKRRLELDQNANGKLIPILICYSFVQVLTGRISSGASPAICLQLPSSLFKIGESHTNSMVSYWCCRHG